MRACFYNVGKGRTLGFSSWAVENPLAFKNLIGLVLGCYSSGLDS